jgi:hypothetical protein
MRSQHSLIIPKSAITKKTNRRLLKKVKLFSMSFVARGLSRFWLGSGKKISYYPAPWPAPRPPRFRPTPPPIPVGVIQTVKSYIPGPRWLAFLGFVGTWVGLSNYDRIESKRRVAEWCKKVEHLSRRPIAHYENVPSVGVWIASPPGDALKWNREMFKIYVKVLFSSLFSDL